MKTLLVFISICISHAFLYSQNLEAEVTPEGIIFPSMHTFERDDLLIPVEGQCIFNLTTKSLECFSLSGTLGVGQWYTPFAMGDVSRKKNNVFLGFGTDDNQAGQLNVAIGTFADIPRSGDQNTLVGYKTGDDMDFGSYNTFLGSQAGKGGAGDYNSNLGYLAGRGNVGDYNVFIGASSGLSLNVNNTLVIESRSSSSMDNYPLIYGDFQENDLTLNATVHISEFLKLQPLDNTPLCNTADLGSIYMDEPSDRLMLCTSNGWKGIIIEP